MRLASFYFIPALIVTSFISYQSTAQTNAFRAGFAKANITPAYPIAMSGYGNRKDPSKGVHDSIYARATAFSDGVNKALIISAEVIGFSHDFWEDVVDRIGKRSRVKKDFIMLAAVHNHSGPVTRVYNEDSSTAVINYVEELKNKIVDVSASAIDALAPATIGAGKGVCKMNINRRASDGKGHTTLGRNPYAPCDHDVFVIKVNDSDGHARGLIVNWPCHATTLGQNNYLITGDWPGAASRVIEDSLNVIAPVNIGASGDINPIYGPGSFDGDSDVSFAKDAIGEDLGLEVLRVASSIKTYSPGRITATQREIYLPRKKADNNAQDSVLLRFSVIKVGKIVFAGVSGEVFNQISVKMRKQSHYPFTLMLTHCNGSSGYLVTDDAYPMDGVPQMRDKQRPTGGYETATTRVSSGAEKAIIANLLGMINVK